MKSTIARIPARHFLHFLIVTSARPFRPSPSPSFTYHIAVTYPPGEQLGIAYLGWILCCPLATAHPILRARHRSEGHTTAYRSFRFFFRIAATAQSHFAMLDI